MAAGELTLNNALTPHRATREVNAVLREKGLTGVTGRVFSKNWGRPYGGGPATTVRTVVYLTDSAAREQVIRVLVEAFPDITGIYRFDRDDTRATYCALGILRGAHPTNSPDTHGPTRPSGTREHENRSTTCH